MSSALDSLPTPVTYTRILLQRWPGYADALLAGTALQARDLADVQHISVAQQLQVFRNAMRLANRADWALDFGRQLNITSHGPLGYAALSAPSLGEGVEVFGRFARIRAPYLNFVTRELNGYFVLEIDTTLRALDELEQPLVDIVFMIAMSFVETVLGQSVSHCVLWCKGPPPIYAAHYSSYFQVDCQFDTALNAIAIPLNMRPFPCPMHDENAYRSASIRCREALASLLSADDVLTRANNWLANQFDQMALAGESSGVPQLEALAKSLAMSPRTLIRRLGEQGTRFGELRAARQRTVAEKLLADARYSIHEIGSMLGYGDAANFGRAFRRQTGMTPGQFRRRK